VASGIWDLRTAERQKRAGAWTGQFVPTQLAGLQLWLDGSDAGTLYDATSGGSLVAADGAVARWEDKSGNSRHFTQATSGSRPQRKATSVNGLDCLLFDGSDDILTRSQEGWAHTAPLNFFVVFRATAFSAAYNALWDFYGSTVGGVAANTGLIKSNGKSAIYLTPTSGADASYDGTGSVTYATGTTHLFSTVINDGAISTRGDKASDGSASGAWTNRTNLGSDPLQLGASALFNRYTEIRLCEFIVYNGTLSTEERDSVEDYLTVKWKP
jgi:hypothetical protein